MYILIFLFALIGFATMTYGVANTFSTRFNQWFEHHFPDSKLDKKYLSPKDRRFISRYVVGLSEIFYGAVLILLAILFYIYSR